MRAKTGYHMVLTRLQDELEVLKGKLEDPELRAWDESEYWLKIKVESIKKRIQGLKDPY